MSKFGSMVFIFAILSTFAACKVQQLGTLPSVGPVDVTKEEIDIEVDTTLLEMDDEGGIRPLKATRDKASLKNRNLIFLGKCPTETAGSLAVPMRDKLFAALYGLTDTVALDDWFTDVQKDIGTGEKGANSHRLSTSGLKSYILSGVGFELAIAVCIDSKETIKKKTKIIEKLKASTNPELKSSIEKKLAITNAKLDEERSTLGSLEGKVNSAYGSWANMASRAGMNQQIRVQYDQVTGLKKQLNENISKLEELSGYYSEKLAKLKSLENPNEKVIEKELRRVTARLVIMGVPYRLERIYTISLTGEKDEEIESRIVDQIIGVLEKGY